MKPWPSLRSVHWTVLAVSLLISLGFWHWAIGIAATGDTAVFLSKGRPIGNNSDLYPRWLGARELLLHGRDPYSAEITREIQIGFYGRPLNPANPSDPTAQESFVYPLYVIFLLAPTVMLPFRTAAMIFRWLLLGSAAISLPLWMYATRVRAKWPIVLSGMLLVTSSSPAVAEYFQQNLAAVVILFLAAGAAAIVAGRFSLAGILLAFSTMKPDTSGPIVLWLLVWATAGGKERLRLLWWFAGSLGILIFGAELLSPHWVGRFIMAVRQYPGYGTDPSIIQVLLPAPLAALVAAGVISYVAIFCWKWKNADADSEYFACALAWVAAATLVILPKLAAYNALLLIPGLLVLLARYQALSKGGLLVRALIKAAFACQLWQWSSAGLLSIGSLFLPAVWVRAAAHVPDYTSLALWPVTFLALAITSARLGENRIAQKSR